MKSCGKRARARARVITESRFPSDLTQRTGHYQSRRRVLLRAGALHKIEIRLAGILSLNDDERETQTPSRCSIIDTTMISRYRRYYAVSLLELGILGFGRRI